MRTYLFAAAPWVGTLHVWQTGDTTRALVATVAALAITWRLSQEARRS